jgi:hypothetical protein
MARREAVRSAHGNVRDRRALVSAARSPSFRLFVWSHVAVDRNGSKKLRKDCFVKGLLTAEGGASRP